MARQIIFVALFLLVNSVFAQEGIKSGKVKRLARVAKRTEQVKRLLGSKDFIFVATQALPMSGSAIYLNPSYDLKIKGDSAFAYLPFYGVAYYAEYGGRNGGIEFNELYNDYSEITSNSRTEISFRVKAPKDTYRFQLSVSDLGYATLNVSCVNRQPIQFYGTIEEIKKE
jgi:hypothetical protein